MALKTPKNGQKKIISDCLRSHIDAKFCEKTNGKVRFALSGLEQEILAKNEQVSKIHL